VLLAVMLSEQLVPGSFAFALEYLVDHELDFSALDVEFKNDEVGASAYDPRVMLKIVLLAYSHGIVASRSIERTCLRNVQFIAIRGDSQPSDARIAKFVRSLGEQVKPLFSQVLMTCDAQGLIGRDLFATDGVKLPSNARKERSGTREELRHRAERLEKAADRIGRRADSEESRSALHRRISDSRASERTKRAIDSQRGRRLYSQRIGTVEPVFGNLRHNKRLTRLNRRGREKDAVQWNLYCMVHDIEKLANSGWVP
jgi:transposase